MRPSARDCRRPATSTRLRSQTGVRRVLQMSRGKAGAYRLATSSRTPARRVSRPTRTWFRDVSTPARRPPRAGIVDAVPRRPPSAFVMSYKRGPVSLCSASRAGGGRDAR